MSHLLVHWLNDEVKLCKEVHSLDDDFKTGYLFGDLLSRFNQQPDFALFDKHDTSNARINNFMRLHKTFTNLDVKFDSRDAYEVMRGNGTTVCNLLYQVSPYKCF